MDCRRAKLRSTVSVDDMQMCESRNELTMSSTAIGLLRAQRRRGATISPLSRWIAKYLTPHCQLIFVVFDGETNSVNAKVVSHAMGSCNLSSRIQYTTTFPEMRVSPLGDLFSSGDSVYCARTRPAGVAVGTCLANDMRQAKADSVDRTASSAD